MMERVRAVSQFNAAEQLARSDDSTKRFEQFLKTFAREWSSTTAQQQQFLSNAPSSIRPLLNAQLSVGRLELQMQIITKAGDAVTSITRRVNQMSGS